MDDPESPQNIMNQHSVYVFMCLCVCERYNVFLKKKKHVTMRRFYRLFLVATYLGCTPFCFPPWMQIGEYFAGGAQCRVYSASNEC